TSPGFGGIARGRRAHRRSQGNGGIRVGGRRTRRACRGSDSSPGSSGGAPCSSRSRCWRRDRRPRGTPEGDCRDRRGRASVPRDSGPNPMAIPATYSMSRMQRSPPSLPFGWGAVTVLLVGALFTIIGIVIIIYAAFGFITGTIGAALGGGGVLGIFSSMMGAIILFVIGGVLAGVGG